MSNLFDRSAITSVSDDKKIRLVIEGLESEDTWLTDISGDVAPNFQLLYSLGTKAYINAFNNRLGTFMLAGIYVPATCDTEGGDVPAFIKFYKQVQITQKTATKMAFNGITIEGWAVKLGIKNYNQNSIDGHAFTIQFLGRVRELEE